MITRGARVEALQERVAEYGEARRASERSDSGWSDSGSELGLDVDAAPIAMEEVVWVEIQEG